MILGRLISTVGRTGVTHARRLAHSSYLKFDDNLYRLTDEERELREVVFKFVQKELAPYANEIDRTDQFDGIREFWLQLGRMGLIGMTVPSEYGGSESTYLCHGIVMEEMSRAAAGVALSYGAHSNLCMNQIVLNGTDEQKRKYLPKLCSGQHIGALAMSEASSGSDVVSMKLTARKQGKNYILNGTKFWITNGSVADTLIVYAKTAPSDAAAKGQHGVTAFIIEREFAGFSTGLKLDKVGMRGSPTAELIFENCVVPEENVLGEVGRGVYVLMSGLDIERAMGGAGAVGIMQASCDLAFDYVHQRKQFGQPVGTFQLMQEKLADMYTGLSTSRSYLYNVLRALDRGAIIPRECAAVFLISAERATAMALDAMQMLGGYGYLNEAGAGRLVRDAKLLEIGGGTTQIRRLVVGRNINAEYLK